MAQFTGSYVYYIKDKRTQQVVYIGQTDNFVRRYRSHFNEPKRENSSFNMFCKVNEEDKTNFEMVVLDLSEYDTLDEDDRRILEKALIMYHADTVVNKYKRSSLNSYEMERYEYIVSIVDFDFKLYTQLKVEKMSKKKA